MSLSKYSTEDLIKELNDRAVGGKKQTLPIATNLNYTLLSRDEKGRFKKKV